MQIGIRPDRLRPALVAAGLAGFFALFGLTSPARAADLRGGDRIEVSGPVALLIFAKVVVGFTLGNLVLRRPEVDLRLDLGKAFLALVVGVVIIGIVSAIPVVGGLVLAAVGLVGSARPSAHTSGGAGPPGWPASQVSSFER